MLSGSFQDGYCLITCDRGKPSQELLKRLTAFNILKQDFNRYARPVKTRLASHAFWVGPNDAAEISIRKPVVF